MKIITTKDKIPESWSKSIFLAGPSSRDSIEDITDWRKETCNILNRKGYDGVVFIPEPFKGDYKDQIEWEQTCLNMADCILFWVPRNEKLPGFTTNVEFGEWMKSGKVILGYPKDAYKMRYLDYKAKKYKVPIENTLEETINSVLNYIGDGSYRKDGERFIPIQVWKSNQFKSWYSDLKAGGNRLESAYLEWVFKVGKNKELLLSYILHADIYITKEKRQKTNEFVFSRTNISSLVAYKPSYDIFSTEILLIKEFRTTVSNKEGYVYEIPGGSSKDSTESMSEVIVHELEEETGLKINKNRLEKLESRQLVATLSSHKSFLYKVELTDKEINEMKNDKNIHGVEEDTERTYVEVKTLKEILSDNLVDWSNLGMIFQALSTQAYKKESSDWVGSFFN